jgi:hypothetical protein
MDAGGGKPAGSGHHSLNAKDNFAFDRGIRLDRGTCVLDLRRKR